jgi:hypothetical protein
MFGEVSFKISSHLPHREFIIGETRDIAAWMGEAGDQPSTDRIRPQGIGGARQCSACGFARSKPAVKKHELSKIDFEQIEAAFKALLQSGPDPLTADKVVDLRNMFRDAYTGWLEIDEAA